MSLIFRGYCATLALMELPNITRLLILGHPLHEVIPMYVKGKTNDDMGELYGTILAFLAFGRLSYAFFRFRDSYWRYYMAAMHAMELPFFLSSYFRHVYPRRSSMDKATRIGIEVTTAIICVNPILFLLFGGRGGTTYTGAKETSGAKEKK
jgi:hypothetical protein